jgi:hypothetical protein
MENLVASDIEIWIKRYSETFVRKLGLSEDDLLNDIREQVWKALLTFNPTGGANFKTYVKRLIDYRFQTLLAKSSRKKYSCTDYFSDDFTGLTENAYVTEETGETLFELRSHHMKNLETLFRAGNMIDDELATIKCRACGHVAQKFIDLKLADSKCKVCAKDPMIYSDLTFGYTINEISERNTLTKIEVIGAINRIDIKLKRNRRTP